MKSVIEVMAFKQTTNPSVPNLEKRAEFKSINPALTQAKKWANQYWRIEVAEVLTDDDDWAIVEDELIVCWENGVKTL